MRQRAMIAMALVNDPDLLIADEPTTALDVTTQAQILALIGRLRDELGSAIILITPRSRRRRRGRRRRRRHVRRGHRRAGPRLGGLPRRRATPTRWGLFGSRPRLDRDVERLAQIPGQPALAARAARGLPLPPALPLRLRRLPSRAPAPARRVRRCRRTRDACLLDDETKAREGRRAILGPLAEAS